MDGFAAALKSAAAAMISFDVAHPGRLPADLDLVIVARPRGLRCWLAGASGDLVESELEASFARLPKVAVRDGNVAAVQMLARLGTSAPSRAPCLPSAWKAAAASKGGAEIDDVIDASSPRP